MVNCINFGQFCSYHSSRYPSPTLSLKTGSCETTPGAIFTQLLGARLGKKDSVLQILWLCYDCCLLLPITETGRQRSKWTCLLYLFMYFSSPSPLPESRELKGSASFHSTLHFSFCPFWETDIKH